MFGIHATNTESQIRNLVQESKQYRRKFAFTTTALTLLCSSIYLSSTYLLESFSYQSLVSLIFNNAATTISSQLASSIGISLSPLIISEVIAITAIIIVTVLALMLIKSTVKSLKNSNEKLTDAKSSSNMPLYEDGSPKTNLKTTKGLIDEENHKTKAVISFVILAASIYLAYAFSLPAIIITPILLPFMAFTYYAFGSIQTLELNQAYQACSSEQMGALNDQFSQSILMKADDLENSIFTPLDQTENDDQQNNEQKDNDRSPRATPPI